jgi:hypothetical protein
MKSIFSLLALLMGIFQMSWAQSTSAGVDVFYETFSMKTLRNYQQPAKGSRMPLEITQSFPSNIGLRVSLVKNLKGGFSTGVSAGFTSTGGRVAYSDYTGSTRSDIIISGLQVGSISGFKLFVRNKYELNVNFAVGVVLNKMEETYNLHLVQPAFDETKTQISRSVNFFMLPCIDAGKHFSQRFFEKINLGYEGNIHGKMKTTGGKKTGLVAEWDGVRAGLGVLYVFSKPGN